MPSARFWPPHRTTCEVTLVFLTSAWIATHLLWTRGTSGAAEGVELLSLTVLAVLQQQCLKKQTGLGYVLRQSESQGLLEGVLCLPWLFACIAILKSRTSISTSPNDLFYFTTVTSLFLLILLLPSSFIQNNVNGHQGTFEKSGKPARDGSGQTVCNLEQFLRISNLILIGGVVIHWIVVNESANGDNVLGSGVEVARLVLHVGLSASLFHLIMTGLPRSFTVGEGWVFTNGLVILAESVMQHLAKHAAHTGIEYPVFFLGNKLNSDAQVDGYVLMLIAVTMSITIPSSIMFHVVFRESKPTISRVGLISLALGGVLLCGFGLVMGLDAAFEALCFAFSTEGRMSVLVYWLVVLGTGVGVAKWLSGIVWLPNIILRKWFHLLAVVLFLPAHVLQPNLLKISLACAFVLLLVLEGVRFANLPYIGHHINSFMTTFTDTRDEGPVILTHFSLLLGMALPIWMTPFVDESGIGHGGERRCLNFGSQYALAGMMILGIGDSAAAIIGSRFGQFRMCKDGKKTIEGTLACFVFTMLGWFALVALEICPKHILPSLIIPTAGACLFEAYSTQLDNMFLPLYYLSLLSL